MNNAFENLRSNNLAEAINEISSISKYDSSLNKLIERLESARIEIDDIGETINSKISNESLQDISIDIIEKRLDELYLIKKKYGKTYQEINKFLENANEEIAILKNAEKQISVLNNELSNLENKLKELATKLHYLRMESSKNFSKSITKHLSDLGMNNTIFEINIEFPKENEIIENLNNYGADKVEFLLSPNVGEPLKPLVKIASGGELSRFMLALKNVIAEIDKIDTLVFDEIDTGISGNIAKEVSKKLYNIAKDRQVVAVTHLPQLASMADKQFLIKKIVDKNKTITKLKLLQGNDVYQEIMRLSGSNENSEIGLSHAKEMKKWANDYKISLSKN